MGSDQQTLIYEELLAVHAIMRRGAALAERAASRLSEEPERARGNVALGRWLIDFVHHHHTSEDELFWPVLRDAFPERKTDLDGLTAQHEALDGALADYGRALDGLGQGQEAVLPALRVIVSELAAHLDSEEPILAELFQGVSGETIERLRKAIIAGAPRGGPDLVLGLLEDPEPAPGIAAMMADFPLPVRLLRPVLLRRYRGRKRSLGLAPS